MKFRTLHIRHALFLCAFFFGSFGESWGQNSFNSGDGWGANWGTGSAFSSSAGSSLIYTTTNSSGSGNRYFRFYGTGTPCGQYGPQSSSVQLSTNTVYTSSTLTCGNDTYAYYLSVSNNTDNWIFKSASSTAQKIIIFRVQGTVRTISSVTQSPTVVNGVAPNQSVTVSAELSGALATGQNAYIRYTTDNFATSTIAVMTLSSGSTYTASIPAATNTAGSTVKYYIFTSGAAPSHSDADFYTINLENNSGSNYVYTVASQFYSKSSGSAALQTPSNWGTATDGSGTAPIDFAQNGVTYNIRNSATASIGASWTVSGTGSKIVVGDGTNACNFTVPSTFTVTSPTTEVVNNGIITRTTSGANSWGTLTFASGATYVHNASGGTLPTATWNANSTLQIDANLAANQFTQTFGNVTVNNSAAFFISTTGATYTGSIAGNLIHNSTGAISLKDNSWNATFTIGGNLSLTGGGTFRIMEGIGSSITKTHKVIVNGNFSLSNGTLNLSNETGATSTASALLEVKGNFTHSGGTISETATSPSLTSQITLTGTSGLQLLESIGQTGSIDFNVAGSNAQCVVPATKTFIQSAGTAFIVANGSSTVDLNIIGTFRRTSSINTVTINTSAVVQCDAGGTYEHAVNGGSLPTISWNPNSTFLVTGITSSDNFSSGSVQSYGNVTWNCPNQASAFIFGGVTTINGNVSIQSTGSTPSSTSCLLLTNSPAITATIAGNLTITDGYFAPFGASTASSSILNISGNLSISGGTFDIYRPASNTGTINLSGNFSMSGGTLTKAGAGTGNFNFSKNGTQTYSKSSGTISNAINFTVNSGSTLSMGTNVLDGSTGTFTLSSGGGLETGNTEGITLSGSNGAILVGGAATNARTYSTGANYTFNGNSAQVTGNGFTGANNLTINNSAGVTLSGNASLAGILTLANGAFTVGSVNTITVSSGGSISRTSGSLAAGTGAGTFTFSGTGTVTGTVGFNDVNIAGGVNFGTSSTINGTLTINASGFVSTNAPIYASGSTLKYNSGSTYGRSTEWSATSGVGYPHHVQISSSTTLSLGANGGTSTARQLAGNLTIDANSTLTLNAAGQVMTKELIVKGNYINNGTTNLSGSIGGDLVLEGNLTDNNAFNANGRAIFFRGNNTQSITSNTDPLDIDVVRVEKSGGEIVLLQNLLVDETADPIQFAGTLSILNLNDKTVTFGKANTASQITMDSTSAIKGSATSGLTILGTGSFGTLRFDQTTPGTTNVLQNLNIDRPTGSVILGDNLIVSGNLTVTSGTLTLAASKQLTVSGTLTNNGTFTLENGATFKQGSSVTGGGTYNVKQTLSDGAGSGSTLTGRYWYMGTPVSCTRAVGFGSAGNLNKVWSFTNGAYSAVADATTLSPTTGYVHRRSDNTTLTFTGTSLYATDVTLSLSNNAGTYGGWHLIANPYTAYLDWQQVYNASYALSTAISPSYYIRSFNTSGNDVNALITYNSSTGLESNTSSYSLGYTGSTTAKQIAPMQAFWVKINPTTPLSSTAGQLRLERAFTSHQTGNVGLKNSTVFPTLARVNLVDGARFDQMLVFMNQDMSNAVDQYDSEKMFVSGAPQIYTMAAGKKLVMNGLKNNKKKISVPLYLELPESKVYNLQLAEYILEDGLILLEDKLEGIIQDFTIHDVYPFYANSGVLSNRFVLHFFMPDATITAQGPSNTWVENESSYTEGGNILISSDPKGKIAITLELPEDQKVESSIQVSDANGRIVYNAILEGLNTEFQLHVPSGVYYLTVQSGNLIENKKVFIQE